MTRRFSPASSRWPNMPTPAGGCFVFFLGSRDRGANLPSVPGFEPRSIEPSPDARSRLAVVVCPGDQIDGMRRRLGLGRSCCCECVPFWLVRRWISHHARRRRYCVGQQSTAREPRTPGSLAFFVFRTKGAFQPIFNRQVSRLTATASLRHPHMQCSSRLELGKTAGPSDWTFPVGGCPTMHALHATKAARAGGW